MDKYNPRRPYEDDKPEGYMESDRDYLENNLELAVKLLDDYGQGVQAHPLSGVIETEEELSDILHSLARTSQRDRAHGVSMQRDGMAHAGQIYIDQANRLTTIYNKLRARADNPALTPVQQKEVQIISATIRVLLDAGYELSVFDGEEHTVSRSTDAEALNAAMRTTDEDHLFAYKPGAEGHCGWVRFVYGNDGWDVINDYHTALEGVLEPVNALANSLDDR